jgi:enoyl-CoA hydratase
MSVDEARPVRVERRGPVTTVLLHRPEVRNAVDAATAEQLRRAFEEFEADDAASVAVLHGEGGAFCAGYDLTSLAGHGIPGEVADAAYGPGPMGPTRLRLSKPVIAAVAGHAVAGGLELALWCDLRVAEPDAVFGVFCRRFGVPLIDGGTVRLPRLIGESRAMDLILTGRPVDAAEALAIGLVNRLTPEGGSREAAEELAARLAALPQRCLRSDRALVRDAAGLPDGDALRLEHARGAQVLSAPDFLDGARRFAAGAGRHGGS